MQVEVKRRRTVTKQTAHGINERIKRYRLSEKCAEYTDEGIAFLAEVLRNKPREIIQDGKKITIWPYSTDDRFKALDRLFDRAFGRPATPVQIDERQQQLDHPHCALVAGGSQRPQPAATIVGAMWLTWLRSSKQRTLWTPPRIAAQGFGRRSIRVQAGADNPQIAFGDDDG
jgi:hypothetical protein